MKFRKATTHDMQQIMYIIEQAKISLQMQGIDQWQDGYPNITTIIDDVQQGEAYVMEDNYCVMATCMISNREDPTYIEIEEGTWLQTQNYSVLHRVAVHPAYKGKSVASLLIQHALTLYPTSHSLRVDTHHKNVSMQRLLEKNEFQYCGIIHLADGAKRKAYEKLI